MEVMKKKFNSKYLFLFLIFSLIITIISLWILKYCFGYFFVSSELEFLHDSSDIVYVDKSKFLILGNTFIGTPSEVFDLKTQKSYIYKFPETIQYFPQGLVIDKNKLLLLKTCNNGFCGNSTLYNLNTHNIDYIFKNTFHVHNDHINKYLQAYLLLNNNNVLYLASVYSGQENYGEIGIFDIYNHKINSNILNDNLYKAKAIQINNEEVLITNIKSAYIYNIKTNQLQNLDFIYTDNLNKISNIQHVSNILKVKDKVLIFMYITDDKYKNVNLTYEFDIKTKKIKKLTSSKILRDYNINNDVNSISNITNLNDRYLLITGGITSCNRLIAMLKGHYKYLSSAEIYDIQTDKYFKINNMPYSKAGHRAVILSNGDVLFLGGKSCEFSDFCNPNDSKKNIIFKVLNKGAKK